MSALNQINDLYREDELPANRTASGLGKLSKGLLAFRKLALQNSAALQYCRLLIAAALWSGTCPVIECFFLIQIQILRQIPQYSCFTNEMV